MKIKSRMRAWVRTVSVSPPSLLNARKYAWGRVIVMVVAATWPKATQLLRDVGVEVDATGSRHWFEKSKQDKERCTRIEEVDLFVVPGVYYQAESRLGACFWTQLHTEEYRRSDAYGFVNEAGDSEAPGA